MTERSDAQPVTDSAFGDLAGVRPKSRAEVGLVRSGDEVELRDRDGNTLCSLNATASALWELCDGQTTLEEIADAVVTAFAVDRAVAIDGIQQALGDLARAGVVDWETA